MRPRVLLAVAGGIALAVSAYAVLAPSGLPQLWRLKDEEKALTVDVAKARADNAKLAAEVRVLQGDDPTSAAVLEKAAREELGWVKSDEIVLTGLPSGPAPSTKDAQ
jgi:cell division protein FtsB